MAAASVAAGLSVNTSSRADLEARFQDLLHENGAALARLTSSYTRTPTDRDDLLQEIATALWQALPGFRGECSERTFLFRIAHNRCLAHLSRRRSMVALDDEEEEIDVEDPRPSAEFQLSQDQRAERLVRAVRHLPVIYRQVIILTLEGLPYKEIAQVLGISESNVGVRLNRARQLLKSRLEDRP